LEHHSIQRYQLEMITLDQPTGAGEPVGS